MTKPTDPSKPPPPADDYFLEIESHFAGRRGTPFIFSAKDWALLKGWRDDGIPLAVVIEAIDFCFDKKEEAGRKKTISSLSYCRHAVRDLWADRKDLLVGSEQSVPERDPVTLLRRLSDSLRESARALSESDSRLVLDETAEEVEALAKGRSVPAIEEELMRIEHGFFERLAATLSSDERLELEKEVSAALAPYRSLEGETLRKTREANVRRVLRNRIGIPRLSLFG